MNSTKDNIRTMKLVGIDAWDRPVYKCIETGALYKDITLGSEIPYLHSCGNEFDGEPDSPIKESLEIIFKSKKTTNKNEFVYQMLGRLQQDCEYYLGWGNRDKNKLYYHDVKEHIANMKELYNKLPEDEKPEWLPFELILMYEKAMTDE